MGGGSGVFGLGPRRLPVGGTTEVRWVDKDQVEMGQGLQAEPLGLKELRFSRTWVYVASAWEGGWTRGGRWISVGGCGLGTT